MLAKERVERTRLLHSVGIRSISAVYWKILARKLAYRLSRWRGAAVKEGRDLAGLEHESALSTLTKQRSIVEIKAIVRRKKSRHLLGLLRVWRANWNFASMGSFMVEAFASLMADQLGDYDGHKRDILQAIEASLERSHPHTSPSPVFNPSPGLFADI